MGILISDLPGRFTLTAETSGDSVPWRGKFEADIGRIWLRARETIIEALSVRDQSIIIRVLMVEVERYSTFSILESPTIRISKPM